MAARKLSTRAILRAVVRGRNGPVPATRCPVLRGGRGVRLRRSAKISLACFEQSFARPGFGGYRWGMDAVSPVAVRTQYQARPGRRAIVVTDLAGLRGPVRGTVELPLRLFWSSPDRSFDLGKPFMRRWLYQTVLREASRPEDLTRYLDGGTLIALWPDLRLPAGVRQAWEECHPVLRAAEARPA